MLLGIVCGHKEKGGWGGRVAVVYVILQNILRNREPIIFVVAGVAHICWHSLCSVSFSFSFWGQRRAASGSAGRGVDVFLAA